MRRKLLRGIPAVLLAGGGLLFVLELGSSRRGVALSAYLAFVTAVVLVLAARAVRAALPVDASVLGRRPRPPRGAAPAKLAQLTWIESRVSRAYGSADGLEAHFRPFVRQVASAELARKRGVVLETQPARAHALLGPRLSELVAGERQATSPLTASQLREVLEELEAI